MISERRLTLAAGAALAVLGVVLLASAGRVIGYMESLGDYVSPLVMGHDAHLYDRSRVVLGNYGWWPGLWAVQILRPLPFSETLSSALPSFVSIAAAALVARAAARLGGLGAAVIAAAVALAASVPVWAAAASWSAHFTTWWAMALAGLTAFAWTRGRSRRAIAGAVLTVVWGGICLSGDRLAYAGVVAPLLAAAVALGAQRAWRPAVVAAGMAAGTVLVSLVVVEIAHDRGYFEHSFTIERVPYAALGTQAANAFVVLQQLYTGNAGGVVGPTTGYLVAALAVGALIAIPALLVRHRADPARTAWVAFWGAAVLAPIGAYMIASTSIVAGEGQARYLYGVPLALGALAAVLPRRRVVLAASGLLALATAFNFLNDPATREPRAHEPALPAILAAAEEHDVHRGYASYFTGYPLEQRSDFELTISPVGDCPSGLCPMYLHRLDGAFVPRPGRTFLLVDRSRYALPGDPNWATQPVAGRRPEEVVDVGDGLTMYVYDHDIAADLGPAPPI